MQLSTLCYIKNGHDILMLFRNKKKEDVNKGKWIGVGGKIEAGEAPEEAMRREVQEETGLRISHCRLRGFMTFVYEERETEYIFIYTAETSEREFLPCDEGTLAWIPQDEISSLALWSGDRLFMPYITEDKEYFSLKLEYSAQDELLNAVFMDIR